MDLRVDKYRHVSQDGIGREGTHVENLFRCGRPAEVTRDQLSDSLAQNCQGLARPTYCGDRGQWVGEGSERGGGGRRGRREGREERGKVGGAEGAEDGRCDLLELGRRDAEVNGITSVVILVYKETSSVLVLDTPKQGVTHCIEDLVGREAVLVTPNLHDVLHRNVAVRRNGELRGRLVQDAEQGV
jgi:hypothetical protein